MKPEGQTTEQNTDTGEDYVLPTRVADLEEVPEKYRDLFVESDLGFDLRFDNSRFSKKLEAVEGSKSNLATKLSKRERALSDAHERIAELEKARTPSDELTAVTEDRDKLKRELAKRDETIAGLQQKVTRSTLKDRVRDLFIDEESGTSLLFDSALEETVADAMKFLPEGAVLDDKSALEFTINGEPVDGSGFVTYIRKKTPHRIIGATGQGGKSTPPRAPQGKKTTEMTWEEKSALIEEGGRDGFFNSLGNGQQS